MTQQTAFLREWQIIGKRPPNKKTREKLDNDKHPAEPPPPALVPVSHATLWRWIKAGKFPAPLNLSGNGGRVTAWRTVEIDEWMAARHR